MSVPVHFRMVYPEGKKVPDTFNSSRATEEALRNAESDKKTLSRDLTMTKEALRKAEANYNTLSSNLEKTKEDLRKAKAPKELDPNLIRRIDKALETYETFLAALKQTYWRDIGSFTTGEPLSIEAGGVLAEKRADYTLRLMKTGNQQTQSTIRELRDLLGIDPKKSEKSGGS